MKQHCKMGMMVWSVFLTLASLSVAYAGNYTAPKITHIAVGHSGEVYLRFVGIPRPGPCGGENNNWVMVPSANEQMRGFAFSLFHNGKPIRVDTVGCSGPYETVSVLYSPGG